MKTEEKQRQCTNLYPDYEQSWLLEETVPQAVPMCGLIVEKKGSLVQFHDDEFPGLMFDSESFAHGKEK
jgi:hypothetical protein